MSIDLGTARRLAYIRYLYQLGIDQARLPEPLSSACVLMLHDAVESFLILAAERYGVALPREFEKGMDALRPHVGDGSGLAAVQGMRRLNKVRVALKHHDGHPSSQTIEQAVSDTSTFLTANTQLVFGVDYQSLSMVQVISQPDVRKLAEAAEAANAEGDHVRAMMKLRLAFDELFAEHEPKRVGRTSEFAFGPSIGPFKVQRRAISTLLRLADSKRLHGHDADRLAEQFTQAVDIVESLQAGMRLIVLGVEYPSYLRFIKLVPAYFDTLDGKRHWRVPVGYAPDDDAYAFCVQFIVTASLRLAAAEAQLTDPAWMSRDEWGRTKWEDFEEPTEADETAS